MKELITVVSVAHLRALFVSRSYLVQHVVPLYEFSMRARSAIFSCVYLYSHHDIYFRYKLLLQICERN